MKSIISLLLLIALSSCSSLSVKVSTANPKSLKKIADGIDPNEKLAFAYKKALQPLLNTKIITEQDLITSQFEKKLIEDDVDSNDVEVIRVAFNDSYNTIVNQIISDYNNANTAMVNKNYEQAVDIYLALPQKFQSLKSNLTIEKGLTADQKEPIITEISTKLTIANNAVFYNGRANLLGDQIVSYITMKENDSIWKSTYNRTASRTYFGNADIAVVLNEMPNNYNNNYAIKGVRVDAAKLIQSTFDVMTQVVNVAASMYGIRPPNATTDPNSFYPEEFTEIKTLPIKTVELENRKALLRAAQKQLLLKILGENIQNKTTPEIQKSVADIKQFWDTYKLNLQTSTTNTSRP